MKTILTAAVAIAAMTVAAHAQIKPPTSGGVVPEIDAAAGVAALAALGATVAFVRERFKR